MKKKLLLVFTVLLAMLLVACNNDEAEPVEESESTDSQAADQEQVEVEFSEEEFVDEDSVVVSVNDTEVTGNQYNNIYKQLKTMLFMYGQDVSDLDILKEETLTILTEQELILQDAIDSGIEVSDEDAQAEIDSIVETNGEEALQTLLDEYELSEEEFRAQLVADLTTMEYVESEFEVEVTDEEIEEQYNLMKEQSEEVGELEEYEEVIRQSLTEQKRGEMLDERIAELREQAEIETHI